MANNLCASNLTSGFIDLATYDEQEKYLYGGPDSVAYFVREIRKATWFTQVPVCLSRSSGQPGFGQQWSVSISRAGDYLLHTWLRLTLNSVTASFTNPTLSVTTAGSAVSVLRWTRNFMHNLIQECNISFNDLVAARFDNYHLDFWAAFTTPAGKQNGYNNMIGNLDGLINPVAVNNTFFTAPVAQVLPAATLNLPLPFFYTRDTGLALPTAALPYNEMRINFAFQTWQNLLVKDTYTVGGAAGASGVWTSAPAQASDISGAEATMSNVQVWANYAIVSNDERKKMACAPRDILIEQVQTAPVQTFNGVNTQPVYDIRFSHAIKALFFSARNTYCASSWSNYTDNEQVPYGPYAGTAVSSSAAFFPSQGSVAVTNALFGVIDFNQGSDPILNTTLVYENTQRLYQMGSDYFSLVNPWYEAPVIPLLTGYHLYSYSLDFFCIDPMGSTNYGKLTNVSIAPIMTTAAAYVAPVTASQAGSSSAPSNTAAGQMKFNFITTALNNNIMKKKMCVMKRRLLTVC
jgi:hypothetical protein